MLVKSHPTETIVDSFMLITYEVCQHNIMIHTAMSTSSILCPGNLMYLGVRSIYTLCVHNVGDIAAYFLWGNCVGDQAKCLDMQIFPRTGVIKPHDFVKISVSLVPLETGIIEHVFLPCFIGRLEEPLMVTVMCAVDNVHLKFFLPDNAGRYKEVLWPPTVINECNYTTSHEDYVDAEHMV